ncbi:endonuclease [Flexivirga endophytica]|uniref:Endonuclease n=1 Tax=Flexivirga endophytica TaxID=1849103 RepID=A0A916WPR9_9MICO|nr:Z1 domain-containing protein [Flexivirga endophytica]GGB18830.1 endonuclease [Flexivirga endophytica]GHB36829.1 endonuclease [Flexivirga endophytica]
MSKFKDHHAVGMLLMKLDHDFPSAPAPVEAIDSEVENFKPVFPNLSDSDWDLIAKEVKSRIKVSLGLGVTLPGASFRDWLAEKHDQIDWRRWLAYKAMLSAKGYTPAVMAALDTSTNEILNCLGDPAVSGQWTRRGLVIGDVQSGKTATYLGAVNKAADAGFRVIILLAGGTEALRKQTQFRVDEGFIGRDTAQGQPKVGAVLNPLLGVGKYHKDFVSAQALTTQASDFRKTSKDAVSIVLDPDSPTPYVFVLKKNKTALENLRDWLRKQQVDGAAIDIPMLVVDDESDYASVNTKDENSPTVINQLIREILATAAKSSYLAFTATPFANVFIDHETDGQVLGDDLFPSDYIRTLDAPTNYVGSVAYFGTEDKSDDSKLQMLEDAEYHFPFKHKSHHVVNALPDSLIDAIRVFVVASAIREARDDSGPRSMLVNVSRFKKVQAQVHELVQAEFERIKNSVEVHGSSMLTTATHAELEELERCYGKYFPDVEFAWSDLRPYLRKAVHNTAVKLINSDRVKAARDLAEVESDRMIAVGGDVLSRGLTLEGLTVSYFHRTVGASDTLLQMARWFGYRPGYGDICRVWIPDEVADQFRYVAGIVDELRSQLKTMKKQGLTPKDFGLAVRMHPEALLITARNKMKSAEAKSYTIDIAGKKNVETARVDSSASKGKANEAAVDSLVAAVEEGQPATEWKVDGIPFPATADVDKTVVAEFLGQYVGWVTDALFSEAAVSDFIRKTKNPRLQKWVVAFVTGEGGAVSLGKGLRLPGTPNRAVRSGAEVTLAGTSIPSIPFRVSGASSRLAGSTDVGRASGLPGGNKLTEPGVYDEMTYPVLLLYLVNPKPAEDDEKAGAAWRALQTDGVEHLVGVKLAIPGKQGEKGADVKFMLNSVALKGWQGVAVEETHEDDLADVDGVEDE